ncbi:MAG: membrane-bound proton-translocating pyrophosphatase, partial [uncultured bacterium]
MLEASHFNFITTMNELSLLEQIMLFSVIGVAFLSLVYAYWLWKQTIKEDKGTKKMQDVWMAIKTGAEGYLKKQLKSILFVLLALTVILF